MNDYDIIKKILRKYLNNRSNRVPYRHPSVLNRKDFINNIFEGVYDNIEFQIDPKCKESIKDYEFLKEDINGKKKKEIATDDNGEKYEKYGHTSDAADYFFCMIFEKIYRKFFKF